MPTPVFLTIDTELAWRHHVAGLPIDTIVERSVEPGGVGLGWQLARFAEHGLKATFFIDPMPALLYGIDPLERMVAAVLAAGQEVQLHLHPQWSDARSGDGGAAHGVFELNDLDRDAQRVMIEQASALLRSAGAPPPVAFRAGSYAASDATLDILAAMGIVYDSSHNGCEHPWPSAIGLPAERIAPCAHHGVVEVPVTSIETGPGALRHLQICAISVDEMRAALDHAIANAHAAVTIVGHSFELANRTGMRANSVHVRRFEALCAMLAERRDTLSTTHFADRPSLALDRDDRPLGADRWRTRRRQVEQLWSNLVAERVR